MSSSLDAGDLTSDSQLGGRPDDSLFSTTAPEPLLRRVSHSSASSSTHSQQQQEQQDYSLDDPSYSRQEFELDESEIEQQQQQSDFTRDDPSFQTPARHSRPQNGSMAGSHASVASTATAVQDGTARQSLTLREQEKLIDLTKKENFSLKLKIYFLEERLQKITPEHIDAALKENIELKVSFQTAQAELKKHKKMLLELNRVVEDLKTKQASEEEERHQALEAEVTKLRRENEAQITMLGTHHAEKESLYGTIDQLRNQLQTENPKAVKEIEESYQERLEDAEAQTNDMRDALHQAQLEMARKEQEIEELLNEGEDRDNQHAQDVHQLRAELSRVQQALEARDEEVALLSQKTDEFEDLLNTKEQEIDTFVQESERKDGDIDSLNEELDALTEDLKKLGNRVYELEEALAQRDEHIDKLEGELEGLEGQAGINQAVVEKLKQKLKSSQSNAHDVESLTQERNFLKDQVESLAITHADDRSKLDESYRAAQSELKHRQAQLDRAHKTIKDMEHELQRTKDRLHQAEKEQIGSSSASEAHTKLVDRLHKDLERMEEECERAKRDLRRSEEERSFLTNERKDAESVLAQTREQKLKLSDKLDQTSAQLERAQRDVASLKDKLGRQATASPSVGRRSLGGSLDNGMKEQLSERNLLLSNVLAQLERIMPTLHKRDVRPAVDFTAFQELLSSRLRALINLRELWERGLSDVEKKHQGKYDSMKREHDSRLRQLDRLDKDVKSALESVKAWKSRAQIKQGEVDTCKTTIADLQAQISSWQSRAREGGTDGPSPSSTSRENAVQARASTAERKLVEARKQISSLEAALEDARSKVRKAEGKWEARLRELEQRLREEKERVKRERQGGKERALELENTIQRLQSGVEGQKRRGAEVQRHLDS